MAPTTKDSARTTPRGASHVCGPGCVMYSDDLKAKLRGSQNMSTTSSYLDAGGAHGWPPTLSRAGSRTTPSRRRGCDPIEGRQLCGCPHKRRGRGTLASYVVTCNVQANACSARAGCASLTTNWNSKLGTCSCNLFRQCGCGLANLLQA